MHDGYRVRMARTGEGPAISDVLMLNYPHSGPAERAGNRKGWAMVADQALPSLPGVRADAARIFVAEETATGRIVGAAMVAPAAVEWVKEMLSVVPPKAAEVFPHRVVEILDIAVLPEHRRRGLGVELMNQAIEHAQGIGYRLAVWFFNKNAPDATAFHEGLTPFVTAPDQDLLFGEPGLKFAVGRPTSIQPVRAAVCPIADGIDLGWDKTSGNLAVGGVWADLPAWNPEAYPGARLTEVGRPNPTAAPARGPSRAQRRTRPAGGPLPEAIVLARMLANGTAGAEALSDLLGLGPAAPPSMGTYAAPVRRRKR